MKRFILHGAAGLLLAALFISPNVKTGEALGADAKTLSVAGTPAPRFNFLPGDKKMLRAAIASNNMTFADSVNANIGDEVMFLLYYHNGVLDSVAHHTSVRADFPLNEANQLTMKAWLWSEETAAISDTATVNLPSSARLQYVPGSTWHYTYDTGTEVLHEKADGITNIEGISIGDVKGCWQYSGFVSFKAKVIGHANLTIDKLVALPGGEWKKTISSDVDGVKPGDEVVYRVDLANSGNSLAQNIVLSDQLPSYMAYIPGSVKIQNQANPDGVSITDNTIFGTGINVPDMAPGSAGVTRVYYKTRINPSVPAGWLALNNVARVFLAGAEQGISQATVRIFGEVRGLAIQKTVIGQNGNDFEQIDAVNGDIVTYKIIVANQGNVPLNNVIVRDALPVFTRFISATVNGVVVNGSIVDGGLNLGTLPNGGNFTIIIKVQIEGCPPIGGYQLLNTAYTRADGVGDISDTAIVIVHVFAPNEPVN